MSNIDELKLLQKQSLAAARLSGEKHYRGYVPCKHGHVSDRLVSTQQCCKCLELRKRGMRKVDGVPQSKSSRVKKNTALNLGKTHYFTGVACKRGHIAPRLVSTRQCTECLSLRDRKDAPQILSEAAKNRLNAARRSRVGRAKSRAYYGNVLKHDPCYKLRRKAYDEINNALAWNSGRVKMAIGYTSDELRERIQSQFQPGMTWSNRGEWEIDHRKPISAFIAEGVTDLMVINALDNLQPLWKEENAIKGSKCIPA